MAAFRSTYEVDWIADPCLRADVLRRAYYALVSGQLAVETEYVSERRAAPRPLLTGRTLNRLEMELRAGRARNAPARRDAASQQSDSQRRKEF